MQPATRSFFFLKIVFYLACVSFIIITTIWVYVGKDLPDTTYLKDYIPPSMARIYDNKGHVVQEWAKDRRVFIPISQIPLLVIRSFLCAEDKNFLTHPGIDLMGMLRAIISNTLKGHWKRHPKGASTITQQVTKNLLVGNERSFYRKLREAILSFTLEQTLSKSRILELYLNQIYLGRGCYGIVCAAQDYFKKSLDQLTIEECAFLASLPKAPHIFQDPKKALDRRNWVILRMMNDGVISKKNAELALLKPLNVKPENAFLQDYFLEEVRRTLSYKDDLYTAGWSIFTTLDSTLQVFASKTLIEGLENYDSTTPYRGPFAHVMVDANWKNSLIPSPISFLKTGVILEKKNNHILIGLKTGTTQTIQTSWYHALSVGDIVLMHEDKLVQYPQVTGGIVVLDADTGEILALSGGYDSKIQPFNCATQAWRQAGSAFKPFVYMTAITQGYTQDSKILDAPMEIPLGPGLGFYHPKNITGQFYGMTPLRVGFEQSRNLVAIRLAYTMGMEKIKDMAIRFKVMEKFPLQLSMALGSGETTLLRLCAAYARIINGGFDIEPHFIKRIVPLNSIDAHTFFYPKASFNLSQNIPSNWGSAIKPRITDSRKRLVDEKTSKTMVSLLEGVVKQGTAKKLLPLQKELPFLIGGKTGTTNECKDAWFIGFIKTPKNRTLVVGVFVGFQTPQSLGNHATGSKVALPIFADFLKKAGSFLSQ